MREAVGWALVCLVVPVVGACGGGARRPAGHAVPPLRASREPASRERVLYATGAGIPTSHGLGQLMLGGYERATRERGLKRHVVVVPLREDRVHAVAAATREGYDEVIVAGCCNAPDEIAALATRFPRVRFLVPDPPFGLPAPSPNVESIVFRVEEAAYLAGQLAVLVQRGRARPPVVSTVGGERTPPVDAFIAGFQAGARAADSAVRILNDYTGDFNDPGKCRRVALDQMRRGSAVVFGVAGECGVGALKAAASRHRWAIGVDVDQSAAARRVLTSVEKRLDVGIVRGLRAGAFKAGVLRLGLADHAVGLSPVNKRVPVAVRRRVERLKTDIVTRRIRVPSSL